LVRKGLAGEKVKKKEDGEEGFGGEETCAILPICWSSRIVGKPEDVFKK